LRISFPKHWRQYLAEEAFDRVTDPVEVEPDRVYQEIGIRSHGKGLFRKPPVKGSVLGDKRVFWVHPDCLVLNIVFAWEQAVARTTKREKGMIASHRFPMFRPKKDVTDLDFVLYFLKSKWGKKLLELGSPGGAGRNKTLSQKEFDELPLCLPPLPEQRRIVAILNTWDQAIEKLERLLAAKRQRKTDAIGRALLPLNAKRGFLRDLAVINPRNFRVESETEVSFVAMADVSENGFITGTTTLRRDALGNGYTQFAEGDILVAKITPCFENGKGALALGLTNGIGFGTTEFHVLRPKDPADADYLHQITLTKSFRIAGERQMTGSAGQRRVPHEFIEDFPISVMSEESRRTAGKLLAALDVELLNLEKTVVALRAQKRGLMQKLLTGRIVLGERFDLPLVAPNGAVVGRKQ
jgi:type I restriction enzyme, S subunit